MSEQLTLFELKPEVKKPLQVFMICPVCKSKLWKVSGIARKVRCPGCGFLLDMDGGLG